MASIAFDKIEFMEGGLATGKVTLDEARSPAATTIVLKYEYTQPNGYGSSSVDVYFAAGSRVGTFAIPLFEDDQRGGGTYTARLAEDRSVTASTTVRDNDTDEFLISPGHRELAAVVLQREFGAVSRIPELEALIYPNGGNRERVGIIGDLGNATTSVALTTYQFFTGAIPNKEGLRWLVNSPDNPNDLNDASGMYAGFGLENRYINFAANLGLQGAGKDAFAATYGGLTFGQAVEKAYGTIIGTALATAAGINVTAAIADITGREGYFRTVAAERMGGFDQGLAAKAGLVGYILAEAVKANVGTYYRGLENFYLDAADGTARYGVDLVGVYGPGTYVDGL